MGLHVILHEEYDDVDDKEDGQANEMTVALRATQPLLDLRVPPMSAVHRRCAIITVQVDRFR